MSLPFDPLIYRRDFPVLDRTVYGRPLIYFDNTASSQTPRCVVEKIEDVYFNHKANVHRGVHALSQEATSMMESTRSRVARFIRAASDREIIFTRGTTEAINLVASSYGQLLEAGDRVVLTVMEHHANIVPWQLLRDRRGIEIEVVPMLADGSLDMDAYRAILA
uniref:aminotransferase class V-fold PLP-dependent enzyme n=1 Tax=uncultured Muribaculum sp. TaxID=1918613 RepID=UPI0025B637DC